MVQPGATPTLRLAVLDDEAALRRIRHDSIAQLAAATLGRDEAIKWATSAEPDRERRAIEEHVVTVAELGDESIAWVEVDGSTIAGLYVAPGHASRGVGTLLMNHAEIQIQAAGYEAARLHASHNAVDFYRGLGFEPVGPESREVGVPMEKRLDRAELSAAATTDVVQPPLVRVVTQLPPSIAELVEVSLAEGFGAIRRLCEAWEAGTNRFARPGEALLEARIGSRLVAVCGLNVDPYLDDPRVGRLRHLYVHPDARRRGIATQLVDRIIVMATGRFDRLRLRTDRPDADAFYRSRGFKPLAASPDATHQRRLDIERGAVAEEMPNQS